MRFLSCLQTILPCIAIALLAPISYSEPLKAETYSGRDICQSCGYYDPGYSDPPWYTSITAVKCVLAKNLPGNKTQCVCSGLHSEPRLPPGAIAILKVPGHYPVLVDGQLGYDGTIEVSGPLCENDFQQPALEKPILPTPPDGGGLPNDPDGDGIPG